MLAITIRRDGGEIHFLERASKSATAPMILMLHGFPGDAFDWKPQLGTFSQDFHLVAPFLPGTREGRAPHEERLQLESLIADLRAILDHVDAQCRRPLYVVGHDLGCFLAVMLAQQIPWKIAGIVNINGLGLQQYLHRLSRINTWRRSYYVLLLQFGWVRKLVSETFPNFFLRIILPLCGLGRDDEKFHTGKRGLASIYIYRALFEYIWTLIGNPIHRIATPTLFLWGNRDLFLDLPRQSEVDRFYERAMIRVVKGGHWVSRSQSAHANRILREVIAGWEKARAEKTDVPTFSEVANG